MLTYSQRCGSLSRVPGGEIENADPSSYSRYQLLLSSALFHSIAMELEISPCPL